MTLVSINQSRHACIAHSSNATTRYVFSSSPPADEVCREPPLLLLRAVTALMGSNIAAVRVAGSQVRTVKAIARRIASSLLTYLYRTASCNGPWLGASCAAFRVSVRVRPAPPGSAPPSQHLCHTYDTPDGMSATHNCIPNAREGPCALATYFCAPLP